MLADQVQFQLALDRQGHDLEFWCQLSKEFAANPAAPPYAKHPRYLYPPCFLLFMRPLAELPLPWAALVFESVKWLALFISIWIAWRLAGPEGEELPPIVALGALLLSARFLANDLSQGNVNIFILAGILCSCRLFVLGREWPAGLLLGAIGCIKVTPALLVVYFAGKRRWRMVMASAVGVAAILWLVPSLWIGWSPNHTAVAAWYDHVIKGFVRDGAILSVHINQSLTAMMNRMLSDHVAIEPDYFVTLAVLPAGTLKAVRYAVFGAILLTLAWACRGRLDARRAPLAFSAELGLVLIAMLLLSGYSWKAHFVVMLVPYTVLLAWLADARYAGRRRAVGFCLAASFALCTLTADILGTRGANLAEAYGLIAAGAILAAAGLLIVRARLRAEENKLGKATTRHGA